MSGSISSSMALRARTQVVAQMGWSAVQAMVCYFLANPVCGVEMEEVHRLAPPTPSMATTLTMQRPGRVLLAIQRPDGTPADRSRDLHRPPDWSLDRTTTPPCSAASSSVMAGPATSGLVAAVRDAGLASTDRDGELIVGLISSRTAAGTGVWVGGTASARGPRRGEESAAPVGIRRLPLPHTGLAKQHLHLVELACLISLRKKVSGSRRVGLQRLDIKAWQHHHLGRNR